MNNRNGILYPHIFIVAANDELDTVFLISMNHLCFFSLFEYLFQNNIFKDIRLVESEN